MIRINLLPVRELKKQALLRQQLYLFCAVIVLAMLGVGLVWMMDMRAIAKLEAQKTALRAELERLKPLVDEVSALERRETFLNSRINTIQRLRSNQRGPVHALDELSRNLPEQIWLETIDEASGVYKAKLATASWVIGTFGDAAWGRATEHMVWLGGRTEGGRHAAWDQ